MKNKTKNIFQKHYFLRSPIYKITSVTIFIILFGFIGGLIIYTSHATTPYVLVNATSGVTSGTTTSTCSLGTTQVPCVIFSGTNSSSTGIVPPNVPSQGLVPNPSFSSSCSNANSNSTTCYNTIELAIKNARQTEENLGPLTMPGGSQLNLTNFESLAEYKQIFVITNLERINRGITPIAGLTTQLNSVAQVGANSTASPHDPNLTSGTLTGGVNWNCWGSNWARGYHNGMGADYAYMYDDAAESWGHRNNILMNGASGAFCPGRYTYYMGSAVNDSLNSSALIVVAVSSGTPSDIIYTWQQALADLTK